MVDFLLSLIEAFLGIMLTLAGATAFVALPILVFPFGFALWPLALFVVLLGLLYMADGLESL